MRKEEEGGGKVRIGHEGQALHRRGLPSAGGSVPFLARDDPNLLALSVRRDQTRLPPLVVRSVYDMEDIAVGEAQALAWQAAVPRSIIVKQSSAKKKKSCRGYGFSS